MSEEVKTLEDKLKDEIDKARWELLKDHHTRGALFKVEEGLELSQVGAALAKDEVLKVKEWLGQNLFYKVEDAHVVEFEKTEELEYNFLIIQPYVLIQERKEGEE